MSEISKRLTKFRKAAKLSQEEVADKLSVSRQTVSKWETGQSTPDFDKIAPLCELYNVSSDELLGSVVKPKKNLEEDSEDKGRDDEDDEDEDEDDDDECECDYKCDDCGKKCKNYCKKCAKRKSPNAVIISGVFSILSIFTLIIYLLVSFSTGAWHVSWIIWLIYAVIITILKLIFAVFGVYIDDDENVMAVGKRPNRGLRIFGLVMALLCLILVIGFLGVVFVVPGGMFFGINKGISDRIVYDEDFEVDFKTLNISAKAGAIDVKETQNEKMQVKVYSDESKEYEIRKYEDNFRINVDNDGCRGVACFNYKMPRIEVYLPENYAEKIEIKNDYGDINVGYFEKAIMNIDEDYGKISVKAAAELKAKNDMGATNINKVVGAVDVEASMGSVDIEELYLTKNSRIEASMGSVNVKKTNDIYIDAKADMGSANVAKNNRESKVELKVRCSMGSINIGD